MKTSLANMLEKYKSKIQPHEKDLILAMTIILVALISFGLGRLSKIRENKVPIQVENLSSVIMADSALQNDALGDSTSDDKEEVVSPLGGATSGQLVASKNGTKYHYPWCSGAQRIKDENKIWFSSVEEARASGYTPASNCKGLE